MFFPNFFKIVYCTVWVCFSIYDYILALPILFGRLLDRITIIKDIKYDNLVLTANKCYLYNTIDGESYPIKSWEIEANRNEIQQLTERINATIEPRRDAESLDRVLTGILGKGRNVSPSFADARQAQGGDVGVDGLYQGQQAYGARDNSGSDSATRYNDSDRGTGRLRRQTTIKTDDL